MENPPLVSVLMPVYNGENFIREAIDSILAQTYSDIELIICNDGCTDKTAEIINSFSDERIYVIENHERKGIPFSRNILLEKSKGKYVAWLDADDISEAERLEKQVDFLERNSQFSACFTNVLIFDEKQTYKTTFLNDSELLKNILFYRQPIFFSSCMARKFYDLNFDTFLKRIQDFGYVWELSQKGKIGILNELLTRYRLVPSALKPDFENTLTEQIYVQKQKLESISLSFDEEQIGVLCKFLRDIKNCSDIEIENSLDMLKTICNSGDFTKIGLDNNIQKAIYSYQVLKAIRFHSLKHIFKIRFASIGLIKQMISFRF